MEFAEHPVEMAGESRLIIVGGSQRSGTTLMRSILDSHPEICSGPEFTLFSRIAELWDFGKARIERGQISVYTDVERFRAQLHQLIFSLLDPYRQEKGKKHIAEKTPKNILVFTKLHDLLPDACFIHMIRDGRDVVSSMMEVASNARSGSGEIPGAVRNLETSCITWRDYVSAPYADSARADRTAFRKQYMEVKYEDLVNEPAKTTRAICSHIGIVHSESMVAPHLFPHDLDVLGNWGGLEKKNTSIHDRSIGRWRRDLTLLERLVVSRHCQAHLVRFGYVKDRKWVLDRFEGPPLRLRDLALAFRMLFRLLDKIWRSVYRILSKTAE